MALQRITSEVSRRGIATLTLNRPDKGNAYDDVMLNELLDESRALAARADVRAIVFKAAGKHFCVGADIAWHRATQKAGIKSEPGLADVLLALDVLPKPTIAVMHGGAIGGGLALACCCDITLATEDAFFSIPEVRIGLVPRALVPIFLRAMDYRAFRRYAISGERITAAEALRIGLVHQISPAGAMEDEVARIADEILLGAPGAIAAVKAVTAGLAVPRLDPSVLAQFEEQARGMLETDEAIEGVASFLEKRKPSWYPPK